MNQVVLILIQKMNLAFFQIEMNLAGNIDRYKARLVVYSVDHFQEEQHKKFKIKLANFVKNDLIKILIRFYTSLKNN